MNDESRVSPESSLQTSNLSEHDKILSQLRERRHIASTNRREHYYAAGRQKKLANRLQIASIIISGFVGSSIFWSFGPEFLWPKIIVSVLGFAASSLGIVLLFLRPTELHIQHKQFATKFSSIVRKIDAELAAPPKQLSELKKRLVQVDADLSNIGDLAPLVEHDDVNVVLWRVE